MCWKCVAKSPEISTNLNETVCQISGLKSGRGRLRNLTSRRLRESFRNSIWLKNNIYILLTKREGRTGTISARGLDSTDRAQRGPYIKDRGPIFSQYGLEQAWLIRDLLHDWKQSFKIFCFVKKRCVRKVNEKMTRFWLRTFRPILSG